MRVEGVLSEWNDERGFGFIAPDRGGSEVFVHISAFPRNGQRPRPGERLLFEIETDRLGKLRALRVACPGRQGVSRGGQGEPRRPDRKRAPFGRLALLGLLVAAAAYGYGEYSRRTTQTAAADQAVSPRFLCDGRRSCSQMNSCAEATFFLRNCPGVEMDGDRDGVPCEWQWCTSPLAR